MGRTKAEAEEPSVRGPIVADVCAALRANGLFGPPWRALQKRQPDWAAQLTDAGKREWVSAAGLAALLDEAVVFTDGTDRLRALGRQWVVKELADGGQFASMRRSWLRTFGEGPGEVARLAPHLWRAAMRKNGQIIKADSGRGFVRLVLREAPVVRGSSAWQANLEGALQGLLEWSRPAAQVQLRPSAVEPELVEAVVLWSVR